MDGIYYAGYDSIMNLFPWSQAAHSLPTQEELEAWGTCFTVDDDNEDSPDRGVGAWAATTVCNLPRLARLVLFGPEPERRAFICRSHGADANCRGRGCVRAANLCLTKKAAAGRRRGLMRESGEAAREEWMDGAGRKLSFFPFHFSTRGAVRSQTHRRPYLSQIPTPSLSLLSSTE